MYRAKTRLGNYDTYNEPLYWEWVNGGLRNHAVYTIVLSVVKLSRIYHTIMSDGLTN